MVRAGVTTLYVGGFADCGKPGEAFQHWHHKRRIEGLSLFWNSKGRQIRLCTALRVVDLDEGKSDTIHTG
jgi:hypothetical protein